MASFDRERGGSAKFRPEMAWPYLTDDMLARFRGYGDEETISAGTILFRRGDRNVDLFVVLKGKVEIIVRFEGEHEAVIAEIGEKQFTGELNLLSSNPALSDGVIASESVVLRVSRVELRRLMRVEGDIANLIMQAAIWRRVAMLSGGRSGVVLLGKSEAAETVFLQRFLTLNRYPYRSVDPEQDPTSPELVKYPSAITLPAILYPNGHAAHTPTVEALAGELGIGSLPDTETTYDVVIVGAGPAGLAAAVYASSEGLSVLVLEALASGGQAGSSSKIENYLGFPTGISGYELAGRAEIQAQKFGTSLAVPQRALSLTQVDGLQRVELVDGFAVLSRSLIIATGARYRKLDLPNYDRFENKGVYYAATGLEADLCHSRPVVVIGGGNSAGQAAVFLSSRTPHVHLLVRKDSLVSTMSQYLISRIENSSSISIHLQSEVVELTGCDLLEAVSWVEGTSGERKTHLIGGLFVMIGAEPNTQWVNGSIDLDEKGFISTGISVSQRNSRFATSKSGIFAVGDVRSGSLKRVASAVGEGSVVISEVHEYLSANIENSSSTSAGGLGIDAISVSER